MSQLAVDSNFFVKFAAYLSAEEGRKLPFRGL